MNIIDFDLLPSEEQEKILSSTDSELLRLLSHHPTSAVRAEVANNMNSPKETLEELKKDPSFRVQTNAGYTLYHCFKWPLT